MANNTCSAEQLVMEVKEATDVSLSLTQHLLDHYSSTIGVLGVG